MSALRSALLSTAPFWMSGCSAVLWGNVGVLCVTVGIFLGTVFLSRGGAQSASRSSTSTRS
jgi:ABC-type Co2+ transport system permease subunit